MKNSYEIRGEVTAIFLKRTDSTILETLISTSDLEKVKKFPNTWMVRLYKGGSFYVRGNLPIKNGKRKETSLHRFIFDDPQGLVIDHINHDTLNNTRKNLRIATHAQNQQNRLGPARHSKTGIRGVIWDKYNKKWRGQVGVNGKTLFVGAFNDIKEAEKAVIEIRKRIMTHV